MAWQTSPITAMYSSSAKDRDTMGYFFDAHEITLDPKWKTYPEVLFRSSTLPLQLLLIYPVSMNYSNFLYMMPYPIVPWTYLKILLVACRWISLGFSMNLEIKLTTYIIYGHVIIRYIRLPTMLLYKVGFTLLVQSYFLSLMPIAIGIGVGLQVSIWNLFSIFATYFDWDINIPYFNYCTSIPRKYLSRPKLVISNSFFISSLKFSIIESLLPVKIKSSTYNTIIKIIPFFLLYVQCGLSITFVEFILHEVWVNLAVPSSWCLPQSIEHLLQPIYLIFFSFCFISRWLL